MVEDVQISSVKDLKILLDKYDDEDVVLIQMLDGEYDYVGFIDVVSTREDDSNDYIRECCLPNKYKDALLLICSHSYVSSQY